MKAWRYAARRLALFLPQVMGVTTLVFVISRLLPGNPAFLLAGPRASPETIQRLTESLGLDKPILEQYFQYLGALSRGDLGRSWLTSQPVIDDLLQRFPATFELITFSMLLAFAIALPLGVATALRPGGIADRIARGYGLLAGGLPDFWWALMLIFVLYGILTIVPAPIGRLDLDVVAPGRVTGMLVVDSIVAGDLRALGSAVAHLSLPAFTLAFVYAGPILKMTRSSMGEAMDSKFITYATAMGLPRRVVVRYALRNALLPVITMVGVIFSYLLSGAVLVEQIFAWGGIGQYAVQAVANSDYQALTGVVLTTTVFSLLIYLAVDLLYLAVDPRVQY